MADREAQASSCCFRDEDEAWLRCSVSSPSPKSNIHADQSLCFREHQYKHHFKKWRWKKNVPKTKMNQIAQQIESRARAGESGNSTTLQGRAVEEKKIRRYLKSKARLDSESIELNKFSIDERLSLGGPVLIFTNSMCVVHGCIKTQRRLTSGTDF
jgi:hypothetical protein